MFLLVDLFNVIIFLFTIFQPYLFSVFSLASLPPIYPGVSQVSQDESGIHRETESPTNLDTSLSMWGSWSTWWDRTQLQQEHVKASVGLWTWIMCMWLFYFVLIISCTWTGDILSPNWNTLWVAACCFVLYMKLHLMQSYSAIKVFFTQTTSATLRSNAFSNLNLKSVK